MPECTCGPKRISPQWFRQPCLLALHSNEMAADRREAAMVATPLTLILARHADEWFYFTDKLC
jgi:hypothetical protein